MTIEALLGKLTIRIAHVNRKTHYATFVNYSGHVDLVQIQVAAGKEAYSGMNEFVYAEVYIDLDNLDTAKAWIENWIDNLERMVVVEAHPIDMEWKGNRR